MSLNFKFNNQLQTDMNNIRVNLIKSNAIELVFDNTKIATKEGTHLIKVDGKPVNNYSFSEPPHNNIYFFFDKDFKCQYIGKKSDGKQINTRLGLHLLENKKGSPASCIQAVCDYLNGITNNKRIIYIITLKVDPSYMAEGVESYFIDYYRNKGQAEWVKRK